MPSFQDSALLVVLALILFGPKKLPELARQLGKLMAEFRRASNEFRMQMEDELRVADQEEQRKKIAAMEAAAPVAPALPETTPITDESENTSASFYDAETIPEPTKADHDIWPPLHASSSDSSSDSSSGDSIGDPADALASESPSVPAPEPLPIATSGDLKLMPPSTGLPVSNATLAPVLDAIPHKPDHASTAETSEVSQHG
jgi:sec-independent protein translocase protein TatB